MPQDYTYAVARIRSKELSLFSQKELDELLNQPDYDSCIRYLSDKGWGSDSEKQTSDELLKQEENKIWQLMKELVPDETVFDFFRVSKDFHNLKVAVKAATRGAKTDGMYMQNGTVEPSVIASAVENRDKNRLPDFLRDIAQQSITTLLQSSDGQLCDIMIDKASLDYVYSLTQKSDNEIIRLYGELFVAASDIKIAVRCCKTNKSAEFAKKAMAECDTLNINSLATACAKGFDAVCDYLLKTSYKSAVEPLKKSPSAFEKWCDDLLTDKMKGQKREPFSIGPLVAYIIARQNEIKAVRLILSCKLNSLDEAVIKERLRDMYV